MARKSLSRNGGTLGYYKQGAELADNISTSTNQANCSTTNYRRSSRIKELTAIYESEVSNSINLSWKQQKETSTDTCVSSPNQAKAERPLYEGSHSPPKQNNHVDTIDSEDESNTSITLRDLLRRCKIKKRKASEFKKHAHVDMQEHNNLLMMPKEEEPELEETISSLKVKKAKSSPTSEKLNRHAESTLHSSPADKKTVRTFPLSLASESGLDKSTLNETNFDELSADYDVGQRHKIENVNGKMESFTEQSLLPIGSPKSAFDIKEVIETFLDGSDNGKSTMNSTSAFANKCDFDNKSLCEVLDKISEREVLGKPSSVMNILNPFSRDITEQCKHAFSSSFVQGLDTCQIPSHDVINVKYEHLVVGTTECESTAPNVGLMAKFKHHINLPTEAIEKDDQHELQFEETMLFDKSEIRLIAADNSTEFLESDCEKLKFSLENDRWLVGNRKRSFSDISFNKRTDSLVSEFKASYRCDDIGVPNAADSGVSLSIENHGNFVEGMKHDSSDENSCLGAIHGHESQNMGRDGEYRMVNENCGELVSQAMEPASTCILNSFSQMECRVLSSDTLVLVDSPCSVTEAGSPCVNPVFEDGKQASHNDGDSHCCLTTTDYLVDADGWSAQPDKLLPSSQVHMLNRCSEKRPCCVKVSDLIDAVRPSGEIFCHFPVSQLRDIKGSNLDQVNDCLSKSASSVSTIEDFPTSSSLEPSTKIYAERQITNMQTTEKPEAGTMFGGQCMEEEHCPKKLLSNRKEISPNSQEKLLRALNNGGLDDVVKLSNCMKKLCFDKGVTKKPLSSVLDKGETFLETERMTKKPKNMNQSLPEVTKGILKSPDTICRNPCCFKNSSIHAHAQDAILFSQRQMQDTENIATKLLTGLNNLKNIVEETIFSEGLSSFPSKFNVDEIRLATKQASKLELTTKKWLAMMAKDCTRFCKIMRLAENKLASPVSDLQKGKKKITFADEAGGTLCQVNVYEQQPVAFIVPKS